MPLSHPKKLKHPSLYSELDQASPRFAFAETLTLSTGTRAEPQRTSRPKGTPRLGVWLVYP